MTKNSTTYYYRYDDTGQRIYKDVSTVKEFYLRDASGNDLAVYDMTTNKLKLINMFGKGAIGRVDVTWNGSTPIYNKLYYIKDHLGSIRRTVNTSGTIVNAQEYYAYGNLIVSYNNSTPNEKYKFTGKERDTETNYDYFGARFYDSDLGHWMSVDPLGSKYPGWSPYNYTLGNPVNYLDINGDSTWVTTDKKNIIVHTTIEFHGDGANDENVQKVIKDIKKKWDGVQYEGKTVSTDIQYIISKGGGSKKSYDQINVIKGNGRDKVFASWDKKLGPKYRKVTGNFYTGSLNDIGVYAHEYGHMIGAKFSEGYRDVNGESQDFQNNYGKKSIMGADLINGVVLPPHMYNLFKNNKVTRNGK